MKTSSKRLPSTIFGAKEFAKSLRRSHAENQTPISHSKALELTAQKLGYADWNTAAARLSNRPKFEPQIEDMVEGTYLKQPFTGRIVSVRIMGGGSHYQISVHFDEAVDVVSFDSFSAYRQRISITLDSEGMSVHATSDGEPHMTIHNTLSNVV